ncbi:MAG: YybH family protein [Nitrososphaerales archaeon]
MQPDDLGKFFMERANSRDVEGIVALYEENAILDLPSGGIAIDATSISTFYEKLLANKPSFQGDVRASLINGEFALTSTRFSGGATAEVARRQTDGSWLWIIDKPNILG